ncbi:MAG: hypothetical protein KGJ43_01475 [Acidobacteriota bacterium]|nr:hypothetical protein [Acidobacteriota bacterium]
MATPTHGRGLNATLGIGSGAARFAPLGLAAITAGLLAVIATSAAADSIGTPPPPASLAQSWCAHMHISGHVFEVGQKAEVIGTTEPTGLCVPATWRWVGFEGLTPSRACATDSVTTCKFKVTAPTGTPRNRYIQGCIAGSSTFGEWDSCDYYAVVPKCHGHPTFKLTYKRLRAATLVRFQGRGWDTKDCGAVSLSATPNGGVLAAYGTPSFHGKYLVTGSKICGVDLYARQAPNTLRKASFSLGRALPLEVTFLRPAPLTTKDGTTIDPGFMLCENDIPRSGMGSGVTGYNQFAASIGAELVGLRNGTTDYLVDAAGKVNITGLSVEREPGLVSSVGTNVVTSPTTTTLNSVLAAGGEPLHGFLRTLADLEVNGDLTLNGAELYVPGNLTVTGTINGSGAIFVGGNVTAGGVTLQSPGAYALVAGGRLNLP